MWFRREPNSRNDDPAHEERAGPLARAFRWLVVGLAVLSFGTLAVWVVTGTPEGPPPVVSGSPLPDRRAPPDQSDAVPHQDQEIYKAVEPGAERDAPRELLASPERPMSRDEAESQIAAQDQASAPTQSGAPPKPTPPVPAFSVPSTVLDSGLAQATPTEQPPAPPEPPQPPSSTIDEVAPALLPEDTHRIQIASVRTLEQAASEWKRVAGRHSDLLGGLQPHFEQFRTASSGEWVRVQGGPLEDKALAELLCAQLDARKVPCLVISP